MKLAIGVPLVTEWIPAPFWYSFENLKKPEDYELITVTGALTPLAREGIVQKAIKRGCTHLLFIDSDMTFNVDAFERLLKQNKDIISGKFFSRYHPYGACAWIDDKPVNIQTLSKVDYAGLAFTLINLEIFKKIPKPWFDFRIEKNHIVGEDIAFHIKAKDCGFEAWVDPEVEVGHLVTFAVKKNKEDNIRFSRN